MDHVRLQSYQPSKLKWKNPIHVGVLKVKSLILLPHFDVLVRNVQVVSLQFVNDGIVGSSVILLLIEHCQGCVALKFVVIERDDLVSLGVLDSHIEGVAKSEFVVAVLYKGDYLDYVIVEH